MLTVQWLVIEPWITPSLFDQTGNDGIIDEWTFGQNQDRGAAQSALRRHWDSWITEDDFRQIKAAGLNHVRIPIGYWAWDVSGGEPYIQGQLEYLDRAIGWARNTGLKVIIDLHGAPGSQNGFDNSGQYGHIGWPDSGNNLERTKNVLGQIAKKYADPQYWQVVTALCLLNEPAAFDGRVANVLRQFWRDAYGAARFPWGNSNQSGLLLIISDGFQPLSSWNNYMTEPNYQSVAVDNHYYQVFNCDLNRMNWDQHLQDICNKRNDWWSADLWLLVGEWSLATTDCARYLNGRGKGARYEGNHDGCSWVGSCNGKSGNGDNFSNEYKQFLRKSFDIYTQAMEQTGEGWTFWTWKAEEAAEWSYKDGMRLGFIPRNPTDHQTSLSSVCG